VATRDGEAPVNPKATKVLPSWFAAFLRCNPRSTLNGASLPIIRPLAELSFFAFRLLDLSRPLDLKNR
jgi:hypothetical protein